MNIKVGKGFKIVHPVGIVIGKSRIGENITIYQNTSIGAKYPGDAKKGLKPVIGNNVRLYSGSAVFGNITVTDNVTIGANFLVINSLTEPGTYVGNPCRRI